MLPQVRFRTGLAMQCATVPCHASMLVASGIGMDIGSGWSESTNSTLRRIRHAGVAQPEQAPGPRLFAWPSLSATMCDSTWGTIATAAFGDWPAKVTVSRFAAGP